MAYICRRVAYLAHRRVAERSRIVAIAEKDPRVVDRLDLAKNVLRREKIVAAGDRYRRYAHNRSLQELASILKVLRFPPRKQRSRIAEILFNLRCYTRWLSKMTLYGN